VVVPLVLVLLGGCAGAGWGQNSQGAVGDGSTTDRNAPAAQPATNWSTVDGGGGHSCAVGFDGLAYCWGSNDEHQLGDLTTTNRPSPTLVLGGLTGYSTIDAGGDHTCATRTDGTLWCWGRDVEGQMGDGSRGLDTLTPGQVAGTTWRSVAAGESHTCATRTDGTLWCWGENLEGQVGDGTSGNYRASPTQVAGTTWSTVSAGADHTCALRTDGTAWCWGSGDDGALGQGDLDPSLTPVQVPGAWSSIEAGRRHTCGIRTNHTAWCWGYNVDGQLGLGSKSASPTLSPTQLAGTDWLSISPGHTVTCGLKSDRTARCWGENGAGAVGDGTFVDRSSPTALAGGGTWLEISAGYGHVVGARTPPVG
jgi:alpha-tubulin suppressor-like RCC1 family protein